MPVRAQTLRVGTRGAMPTGGSPRSALSDDSEFPFHCRAQHRVCAIVFECLSGGEPLPANRQLEQLLYVVCPDFSGTSMAQAIRRNVETVIAALRK